jgi:subtilisin family serine protease
MKFNKIKFLLLSVSILLYINNNISFAQINVQTKNKNGLPTTKTYPPGIVVTSIVKGDSVLETFTLDMNEDVKVIVQFKEPSLSMVKAATKQKYPLPQLAIAKSKIEQEHSSFKNELSVVENQRISQPNSIYKAANTQILHEYKTAINGMAITTKRWAVEEIKKLPYVKSVYEDKEVKAYDDISNHVIGADSVWVKLGLTGKGIKIGILDTGIDYFHPDLGGGIGAGFKVLGGYDFINNDNDPMDDYGHGTHVAGIAAANGPSLKGVAPEANLYAFKVLDNTGSGQSSVIIAGIERALDPDQNPSTDDAVNIISMSLGGSGDPDDPMSQAIDNATAAGVLCVIAAGNSGAYQSIGSPGCARTALTVGATDNNDVIAYFSSRGPSNSIYGIKPDILAPGVEINSTKMGGGYISFNGTSMATPHVAGAAALLLQLHPDWTPSMIKSVVMETAMDINKDVWTQGNGRMDVYKAAKQNTFILPASLSFGLVDLSQPIYTVIDTLWLYNFSSVQKSYVFSLSESLPTGLNINFDQTNVLVNPQEIRSVIVTTIVNNNLLPLANANPPAYTGKIFAISSTDTVKIPYALIKSPMLKINFDEEPLIVLAHNRKDYYSFTTYPGNHLTILLPQDTYDLNILFQDYKTRIIKEGININSLNIVDINKSDAKNKLKLQTLDEKGESVIATIGSMLFNHRASKFDLSVAGNLLFTELYFSDFSSDYLFEWNANTEGRQFFRKFYTFNGFINQGCNSDITQTNDPNNFKHITFNYTVDPGISSVFPLLWHSGFNDIYAYSWDNYDSKLPPSTLPFAQDAYFTPIPYPDFGKGIPWFGLYYNSSIYEYKEYPFTNSGAWPLSETPMMYATSKDTAEVWFLGDSSPFDKFTEVDFNAKYGAPHWFGKLQNEESLIWLKDARGTFFTRLFYYPLNDWTPLPDLRFKLYSGANIIDSGKIFNQYYSWYRTIPVSPDKYTLRISSDHYYIQRTKGTATVHLTFDTRLADKNPPALTSLKIFANNKITDIIKPAEAGSVSFSVEDESDLSSVNLYYRPQDSAVWNILKLSKSENTYSANVPSNIPIGFVTLKISAIDLSSNILEYEVDPAFYFGEGSNKDIIPPAPITDLRANIDYSQNSVVLKWTSPGDDNNSGTASSYDLRFSSISPQQNYIDTVWFNSATKITLTQTPQATGNKESFVYQPSYDTIFYFGIRTADESSNWSQLSNYVQIDIPSEVHSYGGVLEKVDNNTLYVKASRQENPLITDTTLIVSIDASTFFVRYYYPYYMPQEPGLAFAEKTDINNFILGEFISVRSNQNIKGIISFYANGVSGSTVYKDLLVRIKLPTELPVIDIDSTHVDISGKLYSGTGKKIASFIVTNITNGISKPDSSVKNKYSADFNVTEIPLLIGNNIIVATAKDSVGNVGEDTLVVNATDPTPVELISFSSTISKNNKVTLVWATATEKNNQGFEIEKTIKGISNWTKVGFVAGNGTSTEPHSYSYSDNIAATGKYLYRLKQIDNNGMFAYSNEIEVDLGIPTEYSLEQNYPNPFNPSTLIRFALPLSSIVKIEVYNILGEKIKDLLNEQKNAGYYEVTFITNGLSSGIYFYTIQASALVGSKTFREVKKMILMK